MRNQHVLEWRLIAASPSYEISNDGRVRRAVSGLGYLAHKGKEMKLKVSNRGYTQVFLRDGQRQKGYLVARLVLIAFVGEPPTREHQAAHSDGCKLRNLVDNLRWATPAENQSDRWRHGTRNWGEQMPNAKLTIDRVQDACERREGGECYSSIARQYGVSRETVAMAVKGKTWRDRSEEAFAE